MNFDCSDCFTWSSEMVGRQIDRWCTVLSHMNVSRSEKVKSRMGETGLARRQG